jgi:hypothetical protein
MKLKAIWQAVASKPALALVLLALLAPRGAGAGCPYDLPQCVAGTVETQVCGYCGTMTRTCDQWEDWGPWSLCKGQGSCEPGAIQATPCGTCGKTVAICGPTCQWTNSRDCLEGDECVPGTTELVPCGNCGTMSRTCDFGCSWVSERGCEGQGDCQPYASGVIPCGMCGTKSVVCDAACHWIDETQCAGEGQCFAGQHKPCGTCGTATCLDDCRWSKCAGDGRACDDQNCCTEGDLCSFGGVCTGTLKTCQGDLACDPTSCSCEGCSTLSEGGFCEGSAVVRCEGNIMLRQDCLLAGQTCVLEAGRPRCQCVPNCDGLLCGGDGCGGSCGVCAEDEQCLDGRCVAPQPDVLEGADGQGDSGGWAPDPVDSKPKGEGCSVGGSAPASLWMLLGLAGLWVLARRAGRRLHATEK